jgi:hypothetical protein
VNLHPLDDANDVQELMRHTAEGYTYDTARVVREAARRGRRRKNARSAAAAGLGVAAVALFATVAVHGLSSPGDLAAPAADPTGTAPATRALETTAPTTPSSSPSHTPPRERTFAVTPDALADELTEGVTALMPGSRTSDHMTWSEGISVTDAGDMQAPPARDPFEGASIVVDDGRGASQVTLLIADNDGIGLVGRNPTCRPNPELIPPGTTCETLGDGSISLIRAQDTEDRPEGTVVFNTVSTMTADGWMITATSRNSSAEKNGTITRAQPALAVADLKRLVVGHNWLADTQ